ncbi:MAG: FdtA/QdtA family cupin domain-containing protein [Solidesulfovibrio sp.]|jgi:dTDP-4-dehydrorhamnose 3,5-epimerase-like enzyme|uniref:sugar 3,4-ketoisomerase n=1 Tax=Solidesulfovibrio sp. TaxID=2910990 RepID=UPI002B205113|nr:FdtA/QdtA family cupin domain-containing protein [Solidesulfovibrio sp.]MEA4856494.1 FdtA/QdtA family cupin domain-containing protein [Solidesulfovibrio sp.]
MIPRLAAVRHIDVPTVRDPRGCLSVLEGGRQLPFQVARVFYMHGMTADRGGHAHPDTEQCVIAVAGSLRLDLTDGLASVSHVLDDPTRGLYVPPMVFIDIRDLSPDAVCLVLASTIYEPARVIRTLAAYLEAAAAP